MTKTKKYILAGGGTSGHINPALAIAEEIKNNDPEAEIIFCGTARGMESEMIPRAGYKFKEITARGLPNRINKDTFAAVRDFFAGRRQCINLIKEFKPDAVIGTGGYVCSPLIAAAGRLKIPALLHEQNAYPGRSNRLLASRCQMICISFSGTEKYFKTTAPVVLTGNPVRSEFFDLTKEEARNTLALDSNEKIILVMGGSLGSKTLNDAATGLKNEPLWQNLRTKLNNNVRIILAAGRQHYQAVIDNFPKSSDFSIFEYIFDAPLWMAAADIVIARAGAMTCSELAALGKAAVLIPYPYAAGDHQTFNARSLSDAGAAILQSDDNCNSQWLADTLDNLFSDCSLIENMGAKALKLAKPEAAKDIYNCLLEIMNGRNQKKST